MATQAEITRIMGIMAHAYPRYELTADSVKLYAGLLADLPVDILEAAARQIMVERTFFPSIAEWREMARQLMFAEQSIPSAYEAWENVQEQIARCGDYYRYPQFGRVPEYRHPLIQRAVDILGYRYLCESTTTMADRAHFFKVYESLLERAIRESRLLPDVKAVSDRYQLPGGGRVLHD